MKVAAFSDSHGCLNFENSIYGLPIIEDDTNLVCIAGDIIPLDIQKNMHLSEIWFSENFLRWAKECPAEKIVFIGGNHDFWFEDNDNKIKALIHTNDLTDKVEYLHNSYCVYNGLTIFGTPYVKNLVNWAFYSPNLKKTFSVIDNCDILITHQPPNVDKVGCSYPYLAYERNFGSDSLREVLDNKNIKVNICGHIHSGVHDGVKYIDTTVYNVSLLNENYTHAYNVTYFEI